MSDKKSNVYSAFISYASPDKEKATEICESLESRGFSCWIAPRDVRAGREYAEEIMHGIEASRCLVLVLSEAANESAFVRREVERGVSRHLPVFPVRIEEIMPSRSLELFVSTTHWIDAWSGSLQSHIEQLAEELGDESTIASATRRSIQMRRRRHLPKWISSFVSMLIVAGLVALIVKWTSSTPPKNQSPVFVVPSGNPETSQDHYRREIEAIGVDPDALTVDDVGVEPVSRSNGIIELRITQSDSVRKLRGMIRDLEISIGDAEFFDAGHGRTDKISYSKFDQAALVRSGKIRLRYILYDGRFIGPFSYPVNVVQARSKGLNQGIENMASWVTVNSDGTIGFSGLYQKDKNVRAAHLGFTTGNLNHRIEFLSRTEARGRIDPYFHIRNTRERLPVPPILPTIYVRLEYLDGTLSAVRKVSMGANMMGGSLLRALPGEANKDAPALYAVHIKNQSYVLPFSPPGTGKVLFSLDNGAFYPLLMGDFGSNQFGVLSAQSGGRFGAELLPGKSTVQLLFQMTDGSEKGPYSYSLKSIYKPTEEYYKKKLVAERREAISARRVASEAALDAWLKTLSKNQDARIRLHSVYRLSYRNQALDGVTYQKEYGDIVGRLPGVLVFHSSGYWDSLAWSAVKEIRYGATPNTMNQIVSPRLTAEAVVTQESRKALKVRGWHGVLPGNPKEIHCKLIFWDGSSSDPFRIPIENLPNPVGR